ncbi:hypothetical protein, partial [Escherichia coli]|uniref:hypothetical protein n=1 Tax=Escherichia coli TaxID=562 RepID=UPI001BFC6087
VQNIISTAIFLASLIIPCPLYYLQTTIVTHSILKGQKCPFLFKTFHTLAGSLTTTGIDPTH